MHEYTQVLTATQPLVHKMTNWAPVVSTYTVSPCMKKLNFRLCKEIYVILLQVIFPETCSL